MTTPPSPSDFWDLRYTESGWAYGTAPNDFLRAEADRLPSGSVLCLAEGEGRNAVHLAGLGHRVEAVDQSEAGLAKARLLAAERGVEVQTTCADLATFDLGQGRWQGIVSIFVHLPSPLRQRVHAQVVAALAPGGVLLFEAYAPAQLTLGTGGPRERALLGSLAELTGEFTGLELLVAREVQREVQEGKYHRGTSAVVQIVARKPALASKG